MSKTILLTFIFLLTGLNISFSQKYKEPILNNEECFLIIGKHKVLMNGEQSLNISKKELLELDSINTPENCPYKINRFDFSYHTNTINELSTNSQGTHFPEHFYRLRNELKNGFSIWAVRLIKDGTESIPKFILKVTIEE